MGRPLNQRIGHLLRDSQFSLRDLQKRSLSDPLKNRWAPPTHPIVSVVLPTHLPCTSISHTHPLPTKSLRCQVSTAPRAIAPPLSTWACMTVRMQKTKNILHVFWCISLCKVFKKLHFLLSNGQPPESTLNQRVGQWLRESQKYSLGGP